jgi:ribosomal protein S18 acetylase RimI-like enzyme
MAATIRPASESDLPALSEIDTSYTTGRLLSLERSGVAPELVFDFRWVTALSREKLYDTLSLEGLRRALDRTDLFLVASVEGRLAGYLMVVLPDFTDAGEITDLAVHRPLRGRGVGATLVEHATTWARERNLRALWVEPTADMAGAVEFYLSLGFRFSGFNDRMYSNQDDEPPTIFMHLEV